MELLFVGPNRDGSSPPLPVLDDARLERLLLLTEPARERELGEVAAAGGAALLALLAVASRLLLLLLVEGFGATFRRVASNSSWWRYSSAGHTLKYILECGEKRTRD